MTLSSTYFSEDYFVARDRFRRAVTKAEGRLETLPLTATGPAGESLGIDIAWFGAEHPRRLLLHSSGIHGVEGFAGSAIQLQFSDHPPPLAPDVAVVLAHFLNPYGAAWLRRVNENNVDLNRNFREHGAFHGAPAQYAAVDPFLNPKSLPSFDFYTARAAYLVLRYGMGALRQSVAGGQHEFPQGLFFGGRQMEEGPSKYETFVRERLSMAEEVIVVDVHTGLGRFGEDSLLVAFEDYERLRNRYGRRVTALRPDQGHGYRVEGGLESMFFRVFSRKRPDFVGQEFGTYSTVKVLHALREENRWHHFGEGTLDHPSKRLLKQTFCPDDENWRQSVLRRGQDLLHRALHLKSE